MPSILREALPIGHAFFSYVNVLTPKQCCAHSKVVCDDLKASTTFTVYPSTVPFVLLKIPNLMVALISAFQIIQLFPNNTLSVQNLGHFVFN